MLTSAFCEKNSNKLLNKNMGYFKSLQGTDGNDKILSS